MGTKPTGSVNSAEVYANGLRKIRASSGLSQEAFGKQLQYTGAFISMLESRKRPVAAPRVLAEAQEKFGYYGTAKPPKSAIMLMNTLRRKTSRATGKKSQKSLEAARRLRVLRGDTPTGVLARKIRVSTSSFSRAEAGDRSVEYIECLIRRTKALTLCQQT